MVIFILTYIRSGWVYVYIHILTLIPVFYNHISLHFKKTILIIINSIVRAFIFLFKLIGGFFSYVIKPFKFIWHAIFKIFVVPSYRIYLKIKGKTKKETDKSRVLINMLFNKNTVHVFIIIATSLVILNNMDTKMVLAEDLGKNSIIYTLAQGDEFSEITEEALQPIKGHGKDKNIFEQIVETEEESNVLDNDSTTSTPTTTTGSIFDSTLTRNTQIISKQIEEGGVDILLGKKNSILADALTKTSSPETESVPKPRAETIQYVVTGGDTISSIAKQFRVSINTILWENKLSGLSVIRPGDELTVLPTSGVGHTVAKNETLSSIAKKYSAEIDELLAYNKLVSDKQLQIGQKLIVPGGSIAPPTRSVRSVTSVFTSSPSVGSPTSRIGGFIWPTVSKRITQYYHWRHHGLDIGSKSGLPIYASMAGVVTKAGWGTGYGYHVVLDHGGGKKTLYAHMSKIYAKRGQEVNQGLPIGAIGNTGWSTGPHLHFEITINGRKVNPLSYL